MGEVRSKGYIFDSTKDLFYDLNVTGYRILQMCDGEHTIGQISQAIGEDFSNPGGKMEEEVTEFISLMLLLGIVHSESLERQLKLQAEDGLA